MQTLPISPRLNSRPEARAVRPKHVHHLAPSPDRFRGRRGIEPPSGALSEVREDWLRHDLGEVRAGIYPQPSVWWPRIVNLLDIAAVSDTGTAAYERPAVSSTRAPVGSTMRKLLS